MCSRNCLTLLLTATASSVALGADPVSYSDPVGFVNLGNTTGGATPAVPPNTDVRLAIPLERPLEFSGTVEAATSSTIQVNGSPNWDANKWTPSDQTYCAIVAGGTQNGLRALITSHSSDTLTLQVVSTGSLALVETTSKLEIRACWTIQSLFANSDVSDDCQLFVYEPTKPNINQGSEYKYIYSGGTWYLNDGISFPVSDNVILYPGESFVLRSGPNSVDHLTVFGDVPTTNLRNEISRDGPTADDNHVASMSPVPITLGLSVIPSEDDDQIFLYDNLSTGINKGTLQKLIHSGGNWYVNQDPFPLANDLILNPGSGFIYRRATNGPSNADWVIPAP